MGGRILVLIHIHWRKVVLRKRIFVIPTRIFPLILLVVLIIGLERFIFSCASEELVGIVEGSIVVAALVYFAVFSAGNSQRSLLPQQQ